MAIEVPGMVDKALRILHRNMTRWNDQTKTRRSGNRHLV